LDVLSEHPSEEENTQTDFGKTNGTDFMDETIESQHMSSVDLKRGFSDNRPKNMNRSSIIQGFCTGNGGQSRLVKKKEEGCVKLENSYKPYNDLTNAESCIEQTEDFKAKFSKA
jgi:hypothetical protein